jgi:inosine-uridine nucleoside N-ribohydrolase
MRIRIVLLVSTLLLFAASPNIFCGQAAPAAPQLVILDTDIGDDIDDAFALGLALKSPELELLGVTTEFGDTDLRARLVNRYLRANCAGGFDGGGGIPVIPGVPTKTSNTFTQAAYASSGTDDSTSLICVSEEQIDPKAETRWAQQRKHHDAAGFLLDQIRKHPGQVTLIGIGPLFNVEAAIERDPETFKKLKRAVLMGGSVYRGYGGPEAPPMPEWNILNDPDALTALLGSGVPVFLMPLDSTQIHLDQKAQAAIFSHGSPLTDQLTLLYHEWSGTGEWKTPTLFDPVAVTYAIRPDLCPATPMRIEVDAKGSTLPVQGAPNAQVCLKSDEQGFLKLLIDRLLK